MLANHVYYNLGASINPAAKSILNDALYMPYAFRYVQIDGIDVPNGTIGITKGRPLDFRI